MERSTSTSSGDKGPPAVGGSAAPDPASFQTLLPGSPPTAKPLVSIIMVTHNDESFLAKCLRHLESLRYEPLELIVVDNASSDGSVARVKRSRLAPTVIENEVGRGWNRACNQGAAVAKGDIFAFLNPDAFVPPEWLSELVARLGENPDVAVMSLSLIHI